MRIKSISDSYKIYVVGASVALVEGLGMVVS